MTLDRTNPPTRKTMEPDYMVELEKRGGRVFRTDEGTWYARLNANQARGQTAAEAAKKIFTEKN